jgi:hypothetical protein
MMDVFETWLDSIVKAGLIRGEDSCTGECRRGLKATPQRLAQAFVGQDIAHGSTVAQRVSRCLGTPSGDVQRCARWRSRLWVASV